jgi:hypothetical protein
MVKFAVCGLCVALGLSSLVGCSSDSKSPSSSAAPAKTEMKAESKATASPAIAEKDMTHVLTADAKLMDGPAASGKSAATLKKGTKVVVLLPGAFSQVTTSTGATGYVSRDVLDPIPAK